ncbi:NERD domain-containing protein [Leptolyngbya sp. GB1-A1]
MAQAMLPLQQAGWQIEYGMHLGNRLGDADIVCISPQKKAFVIDVKSHRGTVITDGKQLQRQMGKTTYPFEKDFLTQATKQALQVRKQKNLSYITAIVAFSNARVSMQSNKIQKVYVVEKSELIPLLKTLNK